MTTAPLRVSQRAPIASPLAWQQIIAGDFGWVTGPTRGSVIDYNGVTYIGCVTEDLGIRVVSVNHSTGAVVLSPVIVTLTADDHDTPTLIVRASDQKLVVAVAPHGAANLYIAVSSNALDVSAWGAATDIIGSIGGTSITYAQILQLSSESNKLYLFWREGTAIDSTLYYSTSTDGGSTWAARTKVYTSAGKGSYWTLDSDGTARIDILTSDGTAPNGDTASVYHFYYSGAAWHKSDGTSTGALPLTPSSLTKVFDGATNGAADQPQQIVSGSPLVAGWSAYNLAGGGSPNNYWYGVYSGGAWSIHTITDSNKAPNNGGFGGFAIDPTTNNRIYVTRNDANGAWQLYQYDTANSGATWTLTQQITSIGTGEWSIGPIPPKGGSGLRCVWLLSSDGNFGSILGFPNPIQPF